MRIDDAIRQRGFRRWYERQLIEGHAYLVTGLLALLGMLLALETVEFRESISNFLFLIGVAAAGGVLCVFAFRQFSLMLSRAEYIAGQAVCPQCKTYARFRLISAVDAPEALEGRALTVRCRVSASEWIIG